MAVGVGVLATGVDTECIGAGDGVDAAPCEGLAPRLVGGGWRETETGGRRGDMRFCCCCC